MVLEGPWCTSSPLHLQGFLLGAWRQAWWSTDTTETGRCCPSAPTPCPVPTPHHHSAAQQPTVCPTVHCKVCMGNVVEFGERRGHLSP